MLSCRALMSRNTRVLARKLKNEINKINYIKLVEAREYKIEYLKRHFLGYQGKYEHKWSNVISKLELHESLMDDLYYISNVLPYSRNARIVVGGIIDKHINEFQNDQDVLEFFAYILYRYKST
jgi:hypothetical protein